MGTLSEPQTHHMKRQTVAGEKAGDPRKHIGCSVEMRWWTGSQHCAHTHSPDGRTTATPHPKSKPWQ